MKLSRNMCGIVYVKRLDRAVAAKQVAKRYSKQQHRGSEGFGYIGVKTNGTISPLQHTQFEHEIRQKLNASSLTEILFHHRYPTSTPNVPESAHPLFIGNKELAYNYYVVHNGIISNDEDLKEVHEGLGYSYLTEIKTQYRTKKGHVYISDIVFNDSEAFAIELARTIEGLQPECMAKGAIAYIAYQVDKRSGEVMGVYFGTNGGNALTLEFTKESIIIASEGGKDIVDNKGFMLTRDNKVVETAVKLQPIYTPAKIGYNTMYGSNTTMQDYRKPREFIDERDYDAHPRDTYVDNGRNYTADEKLTLGELEEALSDIDDEIIGASGDIEYCLAQGDDDEQYQQDMQNLLTRRRKLQNLYEQKGNTTA